MNNNQSNLPDDFPRLPIVSESPGTIDQIKTITNRVVETYENEGLIQHLGNCALPHYPTIIDCLIDLKDIMFPGFGRRERLHYGNIEYHVGQMMDRLYDQLNRQVSCALCTHRGAKTACTPTLRDQFHTLGQQKTLAFLSQLPAIRQQLRQDVQAAYDGDPACSSFEEAVFCYPGVEAITVYRLANALYRLEVPLIPRMMSEWAHSRTGVDIHPGATIGSHFFIDHGTGVVIGQTCLIGNWVKLYQGVTLGALSFPKDENGNLIRDTKRHPTIEDHVIIYANATILGGRTVIGHDSVIGSSVWLTESVAPGATVTIEKPNLRFK